MNGISTGRMSCRGWVPGIAVLLVVGLPGLGTRAQSPSPAAVVEAGQIDRPEATADRVASPGSAGARPAGEVRYELRSGDRLRFRIAEDPATGKDPLIVAVNSVGEASFPVSRESDLRVTLPVRGKTLEQVRETVVQRMLEDFYNRATVELSLEDKVLTPGKVQFFGEMQGTIPIQPDQPPLYLSEAILGMGIPDFADMRRVKVHRVDPVTQVPKIIEVDVRAVIRGSAKGKDLLLQDGDRVEVPQKWING